MLSRAFVATLVAAVLLPGLGHAQTRAVEDSAFMASFRWRSIGPANMSGRITDIEGVPGSKTFYVAAASGGIWKTTNNGTTFRPVFDDQRVVAMGDLAIAPSDPEIVWAGTGEEDSRNSISPGGGVYKSTDGGMSWTLVGLEETQAIGRIVIHPTNPDLVYVAALGHIWGPNPERGLYRTSDGGRTWERIHFISDKAGFVDLVMHPEDPNVLFASSWERVRGPWFLQSGGPGSALWKSGDGGDTWTEVSGGGFPETMKGRIGIAIAASDPDVMYALVEAEGPEEGGDALSGLYRSADGGTTWEFMNDNNTRPFYYSQVRVDPSDADRVYWSSTPVNFSKDGGKTVGTATLGIHVDHHALWWDPTDPDHFIVGNDGGIGITWDKGGNYEFVNTMPLGQFYAVSYNMEVPYRVCGGLQDNGTWCGPSRRAGGSISNHMWATINGGDGFYAPQHPLDPDIVYAESQGGNVARLDLGTGERRGLDKPDWRELTRELRDSLVVLEADSARAASPAGQARLAELRQQIAADSAALQLRYNWSTPLVLSPHDPEVLYIGASRVLVWTPESDEMVPISPDLTTADTVKIRISTRETGGITRDVTGAEVHSTIVALAESPLVRGRLYAGTDDGNVWMRPDPDSEWVELTGRFPGVPPLTWVSRIEPSHHQAERFYVSFDGHRSDDFTPYVYVTDDGGKSFRSIAADLPRGKPDYVHVVREDSHNPNLLFVGTDVGVYLSLDRGGSWQRFGQGLPTVPVHDLKIHPRERELIAGTHGRSVWIVDIAPLQQLLAGTLPEEPTLMASAPAHQYGDVPIGGESTGHQVFSGSNAPFGARVTYWVPEDVSQAIAESRREDMRERMAAARAAADVEAGEGAEAAPETGAGAARSGRMAGRAAGAPSARDLMQAQREGQAKIAILDANGDTVQTLNGSTRAGLNQVTWNLRRRTERDPLSPSQRQDSVRAADMLRTIGDSLVAEGESREVVDRIITMAESGNRQALFRAFGGGGGGPGTPGRFVERPGENYPEQAVAEARAAEAEAVEEEVEAEAEAGAEAAEPEVAAEAAAGGAGRAERAQAAAGGSEMRSVMRRMFRALRARGQGFGGFGGGGGGQTEWAEPGLYTVSVTLGEHTLTGTLEVTRAPGFAADG